MIFFIPIIALAVWVFSIYLIRNWSYFWSYFILNFIILITYTCYALYGGLTFIGHDEYGMGRLLMLFAFPLLKKVAITPLQFM